MRRDPKVAAIVAELVGVWEGEGEGEYPTIDSFHYREVTEFVERDDHPDLRFDQRTWKNIDDNEIVSHWETGLLRISGDGTARIHNAQPGRVETMLGNWSGDRPTWDLSFASTGFAGDDRVVTATRTFRLQPGELTYEMHMETVATGELSIHLRGRLRRRGSGNAG